MAHCSWIGFPQMSGKVVELMNRVSSVARGRWGFGVVLASASMAMLAAGTASGAQKLLTSQAGADLVIGADAQTVEIDFGTLTQPVTGVGLVADWTAIVADTENGVRPWSTDLSVLIQSPFGSVVKDWGPPIAGDRSIIDFPIQDATANDTAVANGSGVWQFTINSGNPAPFVIGLNNATWYLMTEAEDVVSEHAFSVADGPEWMRPYFIGGVSGLGPCFYRVLEFQVETSGLYTFNSTVSNGSAFTFLYSGAFDASTPLANLFDYGLGNGNAPNGAPNGTSLIEALLFEGETYYFVVSQWDRFTLGQSYTSTITGPGNIIEPGSACFGDLDGNGTVDADDLGLLLAAFGNSAEGDLNGDGITDADDLGSLLSAFGSNCK